MTDWISVNARLPEENEVVLIRYFKGNTSWRTRMVPDFVVTSGFITFNTPDKMRGGWYDYAGRLIHIFPGKTPKNYTTHWMQIPKEPE